MSSIASSMQVVGKPRKSDVDVFGLTHPGRVRQTNEDQFLIASLHKTMLVHHTSLGPGALPDLTSESRGYVLLVADGVGGSGSGDIASQTAVRAIAQYVTNSVRFVYTQDQIQELRLLRELQKTVLHTHDVLRADGQGSATTLTMVVALWPKAYLIQVGDSRCYRLREGQLQQLSRDQTMAQALVDAGVLRAEEASASRWRHVLSSALGATEAAPVATPSDIRWDDVMLLCTDGLVKHVSDDEIREQLATVKSAERICRNLLALALERGGSDNVTIVVGRLHDRVINGNGA
jgi:protein phosphatase